MSSPLNQPSNNIDYASILLSKSNTTSDETFNQSLIKPTIFDIMAQENMQSLFVDSFNHLFNWMAQYSRSLYRLKYYKQEIYLALHTTVEFFYLKNYDALFSEYFYGLKRHGLSNSNLKRVLSILFSIIVPYLKSKLDIFYEELEKASTELPEVNNANSWILLAKKICLKIYPYFHLIWSVFFSFFRFKFMFKMSDFHSPLLRVLNLKFVYNLDEENSTKHKFFTLINKAFTSLLFFLQFFKWYEQYTENESYSSSSALNTLKGLFQQMNPNENTKNPNEEDILEAPKLSEKLINNRAYKNLTKNNLCPICNRKRTNDCALSVSGFVFCYPCIFKFIKEHNRCPITNYPCNTKHLIRLYISQD
jgi:peroxin-12